MAKRKRHAVGTVRPSSHIIPVKGGVLKVPANNAGLAPSGPTAQPGVLTPDSEYFTGAAQRQFNLTNDLAANDRQGTELAAARDEALRRLADQQPKDEGAQRVSANKAGLLHSTTLGNAMSDLAQAYVRQRSDVQSTYDREEGARVAARKALEAGAPLEDAAAMAEAAGRQIGRDSTAAAGGTLVPNPAMKSPARKVPAVTPKILRPKRRRVTMGRVKPSSRVIGF